ncbi:uncharacterized protein PAC_05411 [Phialocephala subalpina]|uniref:Uncharacterized protein n=1 Tax=Phialocephala subalpina TaxID=576137 RepID=A0A1L7WRX1_9HELO|nr:uncharacterized protein PAC_05411 [Phialocephala subalpina]
MSHIQGDTVRIHRMTGWLQARDVLVVIWKLRQLPGGWWLGLMMIVTSALSLTADLAVARLVQPWDAPDVCLFDQGLVMDWDGSEAFSSPPQNSWVATIASNVQYFSENNGCEVGIYRKVPSSGTLLWSFCGTDIDVLGGWLCTDVGNDRYFSASANPQDIVNSLYDLNLQYYADENRTAWTEYKTTDNQVTHLAIWSSSALEDNANKTFDVLVSVDLNADVTDEKAMKTFKCIVDPQSVYPTEINKILAQMQSISALSDWAPGLEGVLYSGDGTPLDLEFAKPGLQKYLNGMAMVQGGSNNIISERLSTDNEPFYGCVSLMAKINPAIVAMVIFAGAILIITILYWLYLLAVLGKEALFKKMKGTAGRKNIKPVPDSTLSWILQAARENAMSTQTAYGQEDGTLVGVPRKERDLRDWSFSITDSVAGVARVVRQRGGMPSPIMREPVHQENYYHAGK